MVFIKIFFIFHVFLKMSFFPSLERNNCFSDKTPLIPSYCLGTSSHQRWTGLEDSSKGKNSVDSLKTQAFKTGDWVDIKALIENNPQKINDSNFKGDTLLHLSIQQKKWDVTKNLLEKENINRNLENNNQESPLLLLYQLRVERISNKNFLQLLWYWISPSGRKDRKRIDTFIMKIRSKNGLMHLTKTEEQFDICVSLKGLLQRHLIKKIQDELMSMIDLAKDKSSFANSVPLKRDKPLPPANSVPLKTDKPLSPSIANPSNTKLHALIQEGNFSKLQEFFNKNKDINVNGVDQKGITPLAWAIMKNDIRMVTYFVKKKANVNLPNANSNANLPLHLAIHRDNMEIIIHLLNNSADVNLEGKNGYSSFYYANLYKRPEIMKALIQYLPDVNKLSNGYWYQYVLNSDIFEFWIRHGADIHLEDRDNNTILEWFIQHKKMNINLLKFLIEKGANHKRKNKFGNTLLHLACQCGNSELVGYLLDNKLDINATNSNGETPLHVAIKSREKTIIEDLLNKGASLEAKDKQNRNPLHIACLEGNLSLVQDLVRKDELDLIQDKEIALYWATVGGHQRIVDYLINWRKARSITLTPQSKRKILDAAIKNKHLFLIKNFMQIWNFDVNQVNDEGKTPFYLAIESEKVEIIHYFIKKFYIDLNYLGQDTQGNDSESYLHLAYKKKNYQLLRQFLRNGADLNIKGRSPFTLLELAQQEGNQEVLQILNEFAHQRKTATSV